MLLQISVKEEAERLIKPDLAHAALRRQIRPQEPEAAFPLLILASLRERLRHGDAREMERLPVLR